MSADPLVFAVGAVHDIVALPVEVPVPDDPEPDPLVDPELDPLELDVEEAPLEADEVFDADELGAVEVALGVSEEGEPPPQPDSSIPAAARPNTTLANLINTPPRLGA